MKPFNGEYTTGTVGKDGNTTHIVVIDEFIKEKQVTCGVRRKDNEIYVTGEQVVRGEKIDQLKEQVNCSRCLKKHFNINTKNINNRGKRQKKAGLVENNVKEVLEELTRDRSNRENKKVSLQDEIQRIAGSIGVSSSSVSYVVYSGGSSSLYLALQLSNELEKPIEELFYLKDDK